MSETIETFKYKDMNYEIKKVTRPNGTWFLKDYKDNKIFSPYYYGINDEVKVAEIEAIIDAPIEKHLIELAKEGIKLWVEKGHIIENS